MKRSDNQFLYSSRVVCVLFPVWTIGVSVVILADSVAIVRLRLVDAH